jgi:hypothetical protein
MTSRARWLVPAEPAKLNLYKKQKTLYIPKNL